MCSLDSFSIVLIAPYINKRDSSRNLIIFMTSPISSFEIITAIVLALISFLRITASAAKVVVVNPNCIKTLLAIGLGTFFINSRPVCNNGPRSLPRNLLNCIVLDSWVFDNSLTAIDYLQKL